MHKIAAILFFLILLTRPAAAEDLAQPGALQKGARQQVTRVIDGDTVLLADKTRVRLVGIQAPKLPLGRKGFRQWPLSPQSKKALSDLVLNRFVTLYYGGRSRDRYDRALAHLFRDDGLWVQGEMLTSGMARVYSFADNRAMIDQMMQREQDARHHNRGIWALDYYRPKDQAVADRHRNSFQVVTGTVRAVAHIRGAWYLNFGDDWREDFTIVIKAKAARLFDKSNLRPDAYQGKKIEARGWLKSYNGPMIEATHPEQIMIIE